MAKINYLIRHSRRGFQSSGFHSGGFQSRASKQYKRKPTRMEVDGEAVAKE
jgi:hypothetical protein